MMYGMSEKGLASRLGVDQLMAREIMSMFFTSFPAIKNLIDEETVFCKKYGYVSTMDGRKRRLPGIYSEDKYTRLRTARQILNSDIQGSAAGIMKLAMVNIENDKRLSDIGWSMLLSVHDEVICEGPRSTAIQAAKYITEDMTCVIELAVPLKVDAEIFTDGQWYGESIKVKQKSDGWHIIQEVEDQDKDTGKAIMVNKEITEKEANELLIPA